MNCSQSHSSAAGPAGMTIVYPPANGVSVVQNNSCNLYVDENGPAPPQLSVVECQISPIYLAIDLSIDPSSYIHIHHIHINIHILSIGIHAYPSKFVCIHLYPFVSIYIHFNPSIYPSISIYVHLYRFIWTYSIDPYRSLSMSAYLPICLAGHLSICLSIYLSIDLQ